MWRDMWSPIVNQSFLYVDGRRNIQDNPLLHDPEPVQGGAAKAWKCLYRVGADRHGSSGGVCDGFNGSERHQGALAVGSWRCFFLTGRNEKR